MLTNLKIPILIAVIFLWIAIGSGTGWWLWKNYQTIIQPDPGQVQAATVELNTEALTQAIELIESQ